MNVLVMCVGAFQTLVGLALAGAQREWLWRENPEVAAGSSGSHGSGTAGATMRHWYLEPSGVWPDVEVADARGFLTQFVRFVVLLNALIPISLYVTLELVKVIQCAPVARERVEVCLRFAQHVFLDGVGRWGAPLQDGVVGAFHAQ